MSVCATIAAKNEDGTISIIYCTEDGYLFDGVGEMLYKNYKNLKKVQVLFRKGNIHKLGSIPYSKPEYWTDPDNCIETAEERTMALVDSGHAVGDTEDTVFAFDEETFIYRYSNYYRSDYNYIFYNGIWYMLPEKFKNEGVLGGSLATEDLVPLAQYFS